MKKVFFSVLLLFAFSNIALGQSQMTLKTSAYVHGYWTDWWGNGYSTPLRHWHTLEWTGRGTFAGLEFRDSRVDPWNWCFKMYLDGDYLPIGKKALKKFQKEHDGSWCEYPGWVEYYVSDEYPTIEKILEKEHFPFIDPTTKTSGKIVKRKAKAVVKVSTFSWSYNYSYPCSFEILFDGCGLRISL